MNTTEYLKSQCNRYANSECTTLSCMKRGGFVPGVPATPEIATCEYHESITALELLDWMNQERLTVTWNPYHDAFIVQRYHQVCGNIGVGKTVIEALAAART